MQIFSLQLLRQQRKDPSSFQFPNFNLQMSFCAVSGTEAAVKCFIWHRGPGGFVAGIRLSLARAAVILKHGANASWRANTAHE